MGADDRTSEPESERPTRAERRAAARDERYRKDLERQRSLSETGPPPEKRMRRALKQVRREGYKVALIYAVLDAALVALVVNLLVQVGNPAELPETVPWPVVVYDAIVRYAGTEPGPLQAAIVVGLAAGAVVFVLEFLLRIRRPFVKQFEGANPAVQEALRTARDTLRAGRDTRMALRLYEDVLARLRRTSSLGLLSLRRLFLVVVLLSAVSVGTIQVAVVDLDISDLDRGDSEEREPGPDSEYEGLQDASGVLGEPENVTAGEETLDTTLSTQGGGDDGDASADAAYDSSGFSGADDVEGQEAGFAEREQLEDAELIREYNLRIREDDESDT